MPEETLRSDPRYYALICDVLQAKKSSLFAYIVWNGQALSQEAFVEIALRELEKIGPVLRLIVTLQYRLDETEKAGAFTPRISQEIRRAAKGRIPKNFNIRTGRKALQSLEISPPFSAFLMPTPEEISQLKQELQTEKEDKQRLIGELEDTRMRLAEAEREKQILQRKLDSQLWRRIWRLFSRSKAAPA